MKLESIAQQSWLYQALNFLFGYDFFISYAHSDAGGYAEALADILQQEGFECFLDRRSFVKGDNWRIAGHRALKKTQRLILLASPRALTSEPVLTELKIFRGEGKRVIPIDFGGTLNREKHQSKIFDYISEEDLWISESIEYIAPRSNPSEQKPSNHVIVDLINSFNLERQEKKRLKWIMRFAILLMFLTVTAIFGAGVAIHQRTIAQKNERRAISQLALSDLQRGVEQCQQGRLRSGVMFLLRGYQTSQLAKNSNLSASASTLLASWSRYLGPYTSHNSEVTEVAYSPDGQYVVSGDSQGNVTVFDKFSGKLLALLNDHQDSIQALLFSNDGKVLITASQDGHAFIWDVPKFERRIFALKHEGRINSVAITADGRRVATGSDDNTASIWDIFEETHLSTIEHAQRVGVVSFTPDGSILGTGSNDDTARLWDAFDGSPVGRIMQHEGPVNSLAFSSNGELLATDNEKVVQIWDAKTQEIVASTSPHSHVISDLAFSPDGKYLISGSYDKSARIWAVKTGRPEGGVMSHSGQISSVDYAADGDFVATADYGNFAQVWIAPSGQSLGIPFVHNAGINAMSIDPVGESLLTGSQDGQAHIWHFGHELPQHNFLASPKDLDNFVISSTESADAIAFSPTQNILLAGGINDSAQAWNVETGRTVSEPLEHNDSVDLAGISSNGTYAFTAYSNTVQVWTASEEFRKGKSLEHPNRVLSAVFLSDNLILTGSEDQLIRIWNASTGELIDDSAVHAAPVIIVAVSSDGQRYFTASTDGTGKLWDAKTRTTISTVIQHIKGISDAAFSLEGNLLVTSSYDGNVSFWDSRTGVQKSSNLHGARVRSVAVSPNGKTVASAGDDNSVRLWSVLTKNAEGPMLRHNDIVTDVAFSPDGAVLATASDDGTAVIWDSFTSLPLTPPLAHSHRVATAVFSKDGQYLVTSDLGLNVRAWNISALKRFDSLDEQSLELLIESLTGLRWNSTGGISSLSQEEVQLRQ
ncbi:MAG: TIR domain-containing protein [Leptolyngbya sp. SIO3F4]|nr:TIR domain-containing protein [Leptolyngbya sp. SIO3F4]